MYQVYVRQKRDTSGSHAEAREAGPSQAVPETEGTFSQRWRGKFVPAEHDDERYRVLAKRYL